MLESGFFVAFGLLFVLNKLSWKRKMWLISNPVAVDVFVFVTLVTIHWGTFTGVMAATIGALFCSITLSAAKWLVGHVVGNMYYPGVFNIAHKLVKEK